ncbi:MAG: glycosyltransferase family 1 protein [Sphaerochaetaceae bacterium]|nr:glycosyltransferase family 1 protein [Sphaerochaetaceae bacterium]
MRIGIFLNNSSIPSAGGAFTQREAIIESLSQADTNHEFFYFFYGQNPTNGGLKNCVSLKGKKIGWLLKQMYYFTGFNFFKKFIPLNKALEKNKIDLLYFLEPNYQLVLVPYIASVWDIAHLHVPFFPEMYKNNEWEKREVMYQNHLRKASFVVATTDAARVDISKQYVVPVEKVRAITTPIADVFFKEAKKVSAPKILAKYNLPKDFFVYPAQFWPHKNHYQILEALKIINNVHKKKMHVVLVGSNKGNLNYLKSVAKKMGVEEQVHFLGFVPTEVLIELYKNATASLYMTFVDAEGLPPAESFVMGCPVIAAKIPCLVDQLKDAALLVDPLNSNDLANAMYSLGKDNKLRLKLINNGNKISKKLRKEVFAKEIIALFEEFANYKKRWGD